MTTQLQKLDHMVSQAVADGTRTGPEIRTLISTLRTMPGYSEVSDDEGEVLARDIEARIGVSMGLGAVVDDHDGEFVPWLDDAKVEKRYDPYYWPRYERLLREQGLPEDVIRKTDDVTDLTLARLGNPHKEGAWDRRGMVVGHVQSGKTANYTGLVCKAADAGYRFIVVIAGIHNNLRNQTQARIDEGFIGRDTGRLAKKGDREGPKIIGVGKYDGSRMPVSLTTTIKDFNKATATTNTTSTDSYKHPLVLVIKKNPSTLRNLLAWLQEYSAGQGTEMVSQPMLLIDDEADNASINTKYGKEEATRINGQIRDLLKMFRRSCYVGYTATPFANIFIDPDSDSEVFGEDLFPRNFIIGLDAPTNYFGPRKVFIDGMPEDDEPVWLRYIDDNADVLPVSHKKDDSLETLPESLVKALRTFIVARAIRNVRGQGKSHASMLVNASRFTDMQGRLKSLLQDRLDTMSEAVQVDGAKGSAAANNPEIAALKEAWSEEYADAEEAWAQVQDELHGVLAPAKVVQVNSKENGLDYDEAGDRGLTVIAVGGYSLSRGLTLEGLTVTYFLRNSKMYDTLMQMGRWFGYRTNYEDLCRIWMPREAADWYSHIAGAGDELHRELHRMQRAGSTPQDFGLAVRSHPSSLMVTARNKIGAGRTTVLIGLSNAFVETSRLLADPEVLEENRKAARTLIADMEKGGWAIGDRKPEKGGFLLRGVPVVMIDDFLLGFRNADESIVTEIRPLREYIADRAGGELAKWDVFVTSVRHGQADARKGTLGPEIGPLQRNIGDGMDLACGILAINGSKMRVASRGVERIGVEEEVAKNAEEEYLGSARYAELQRKKLEKGKPSKGSDRINFPDDIYRNVRARPLLVLSLVETVPPAKPKEAFRPERMPDEPVVAWGISFPRSATAHSRVEYVVNPTKWREMFGEEDADDEDEMIDDE